MSLSIGFVARDLRGDSALDLAKHMQKVAERYGYRLSFGIEHAIVDIRGGLSNLLASWRTDFCALLHAPATEPEPLAAEVGVQLEEAEESPFFDFVLGQEGAFGRHRDASVFFAIGWPQGGRVRRQLGSAEELICRLRTPFHWTEPLYDPMSDAMWCGDELPLLFTFTHHS